MKKFLLVSAVIASLSIPAYAADMALKAPVAAPAFTWTSCFLGAHAGGGWAQKDITDPLALALGTPAAQTTGVSLSGAVVGGQFGCDYQFAPNWVAGIEGSASGATMKGDTTVGGGAALVTSRTDFLGSVTGRLGYAVDRWLLYVRGGVALAGDKYNVTGAGFSFEGLDSHPGWTAGAGIEWAFARNWSARLEYDYYGLGTRTVLMDPVNLVYVNVKESAQTVKLGVNFHMWGGQ